MKFKHILWLDFETRSRVNLKTAGAYRYVACPDHRILIAGYALDNAKPKAAILGANGGGMPIELNNMLLDPKVQIRAHNAAFDRLQLGKAAPPIDRWYCTAAQARAIAMPGSLEDLGRAIGAKYLKNARGADLMRKLSIPDKEGNFSNDPKLMREFADYCADDIYTMRACSENMPDLRDEDLAVYHASERINDRGLPIDVELCRLAVQYAATERIEAEARVIELSAGALSKVQGPKLTQWVYSRLDPIMRKHMEVIRIKKIDKKDSEKSRTRIIDPNEPDVEVRKGQSLSVDIRATLLEIAEDNPDAIAPEVVDMIEAAEAGSLMSTAKFQSMLNRVSADDRLRGAFMFNGAYQTNRWSSVGAQVHNYPRDVAKDPEAILAKMRRGEPLPGVLKTLKSMLRPAIKPKGRKLIVRADWNAVEARGLPWLVNTPASLAYMAAFNDDKRDIYTEQAMAAGLGPVRQAGKIVVLALGYGGSENALAKTAKSYGVTIDDKGAVVNRWRRANPWVSDKRVGWWKSLERCTLQAMAHPGKSFHAGRVSLCKEGSNLTMLLPSGRRLHYPMAKVVEGTYGPEVAYLKASWKPKAGAKEWPVARLWHGVTAENADQATCADLLRDALVRCERDGIEVIGHVHDEIITEAEPRKAKAQGQALGRCMLASSAWAKGFPLKVEVDISPRFRK